MQGLNMNNSNYTFLILHYNVIDATKKCVESIKHLNCSEKIKILIVDNGSPNGSGAVLRDEYKDDKSIEVMMLENNLGFSAGNNAGFKKIMSGEIPDYLIVTNNDIIFNQPDFCQKIDREYNSSQFDILGPDIFTPKGEMHQNPVQSKLPSLAGAWKTFAFNSIAVALYPVAYKVVEKVMAPRPPKKTEAETAADLENEQMKPKDDAILHGSCMIYSSKYLFDRFHVHKALFYPETFFYYEENIQTLWCKMNKRKTVFNPELQVLHMHWKATATVAETNRKRMLFMIKNIRKSAFIYIKAFRIFSRDDVISL